jgi:hypothetical protein
MSCDHVHVRSQVRPGRLICGRADSGGRTVKVEGADREANLCAKCRQRLAWERAMIQVRNAPKPGLQLSWFRLWKDN